MAHIKKLQIENFRCILSSDQCISPNFNVIYGKNGSGKTAWLESMFVQSRIRSFRSSVLSKVVNDEAEFALIRASLENHTKHPVQIGLQVSQGGWEGRIQTEKITLKSQMAQQWAVSLIDPQIHDLVSGAPEQRRQFLDWGLFHVEPDYLGVWQQYKRILKQRNHGLKHGSSPDSAYAWDRALEEYAPKLSNFRQVYVDSLKPYLNQVSEALLEIPIEIDYKTGWRAGLSYEEALFASFERDRNGKTTHVGPHRADITIKWQSYLAKQRVSRGQQKCAGLALSLAQIMHLLDNAQSIPPLTLLLDDPSAELDSIHLKRLFKVLRSIPVQQCISALTYEEVAELEPESVFHVEHGNIQRKEKYCNAV